MNQLKALKVFCAVAESGGLASAARALAMSPPSVTRIINDLEAHVGTPLLHRTTRSVTLTETGAAYLAHAQRILEDVQAADDAARGANQKPTGTLRITASVLFGQHYIAPIVRDFVDDNPDVRVKCVFVDRIVNIIDEGIDVAVRIGPLPDSSLRAVRVGSVRHVVCASPGYLEKHGEPTCPSDLVKHQLIGFDGMGGNEWSFDDGRHVLPEPRVRFSTIAPCIESARLGWGLTQVLSYQVGPELGAGTLRIVLNDFASEEWPVHLVHAEARQRSAKVRSFMKLATTRLRREKFLN